MSDGQILRTGVLFKKGSGTGPFGRKNWKPRYFVLTPSRLQYFTFEDGELKGELSLQGCDEGVLEVMPADSMKTGSSASTIWRVAINAPERRLLVAAGTEMEMNDWVDKLVLAFRINSGQPPIQRASMPATSSTLSSSNPSTASIRDFQNFSVPRRGVNQRYSVGAEVGHPASSGMKEVGLERATRTQQQVERQDGHAHEDVERRVAMQEKEEEAVARAAAMQELQRQEEQEKVAQKEREVEERQEAVELERVRLEEEEAARLRYDQEQEKNQSKRVADEMMMQEHVEAQQGDDPLEIQRRQKREEHARQRAEREQTIKLKMQQEFELKKQTQEQVNPRLSVDDSEITVELDASTRSSNEEDAVPTFVSRESAFPPRSSLVGDVKREMIQKQQLEYQRRREAALKQEQLARDAEVEQQRAKMEALDVREAPREVEVAPREIEVVRRAPPKKTLPDAADPMEGIEF
ncbi:hypothetical protein PsorP6_007292 [Peronosclerospora sorghi]|uniref:Uncharacterized protein n=1 Tax=Peronosclerospora sorghi TaxID=230839 RepID=A0ACC0W740_9STRA|nr:hypothetical protein PsorP6_007292 [Peronosclerospora sorghi]